MSSYIVSAKHFASLKHYTPIMLKHTHFNSYNLKRFGYDDDNLTELELKEVLTDLFSKLEEANVLCNAYQYQESLGIMDTLIQAELKHLRKLNLPIKNLSALGYYNALKCLHYQIEIEHIEGIRDDLIFFYYEFLETLINCTAQFVCSLLPDDSTNKWEIN